MADGTYERRGPREAELKRFQRMLAAAKGLSAGRRDEDVASTVTATPSDRPVDATPSSRHFETEDNG